jgi:hypothetical protein
VRLPGPARDQLWSSEGQLLALGPVTGGARDLRCEASPGQARVLRCLAPAQQDQPAEHPDHEQVQQTDRHEPPPCSDPADRAKSQLTRTLC